MVQGQQTRLNPKKELGMPEQAYFLRVTVVAEHSDQEGVVEEKSTDVPKEYDSEAGSDWTHSNHF